MKHVSPFPFVDAPKPLIELADSKVYKLREQLNQGKQLSDSNLEWLSNNNRYGGIKLGGWHFDFSDALHEYWVQVFDSIERRWAHDECYLEQLIIEEYGLEDKCEFPRIVDITMYEKLINYATTKSN